MKHLFLQNFPFFSRKCGLNNSHIHSSLGEPSHFFHKRLFFIKKCILLIKVQTDCFSCSSNSKYTLKFQKFKSLVYLQMADLLHPLPHRAPHVVKWLFASRCSSVLELQILPACLQRHAQGWRSQCPEFQGCAEPTPTWVTFLAVPAGSCALFSLKTPHGIFAWPVQQINQRAKPPKKN